MASDSKPWLSLDGRAAVEASSEQDGYPVTGPLQSMPANDWRASGPGPQVVRLQFGTPQRLRRIRLVFRELERARTQEFALFCTAAGGERREIVRQQYTFAPNGGATIETEEYALDMDAVLSIELHIVPEISGGPAIASLAELRVA